MSKGVLWALNNIFNTIDKVWRYRFFDNEYVNKIFGGALIVACSWLVLKTIIELVMNYIIKNDERSSPFVVYRGVLIAIVMMFLITPLFQFGQNVSTALNDAVLEVSSMTDTNSDTSLSSSIIRAMVYDNEMEEDKIEELVSNYKTIDINETTGGFVGLGDVYVYSLNFFMLFVISIIMVFLLFYVGIQIASRVMEIALYKVIGPFCCTSLTTSQAGAFNVWCKSTMGAFLVTVVQFVCIGLLLNLCADASNDTGIGASIFLILGALIFIITTPTIIKTLLNQQSGVSEGLGGIQSIIAMASSTGRGLSYAKDKAVSIGSAIVSGGTKLGRGFVNMANKFRESSPEMPDSANMDFKKHNNYSASQKNNNFFNSNNNPSQSNGNRFRNSSSINPMRNLYINQNKMKNNVRKWT